MQNKRTGNIGEALAVKYLKEQGYKDIQTNVKNKLGEIDIIAKLEDIIVFVEVKTRTSYKVEQPKQAVNKTKQNKIRLVATAYLKYKGLLDNVSVRFDVIEILGNSQDYTVNHIQNAF